MRRRHAGATLDLVARVPPRNRRVGDAGRHDVGLGQLTAARAEPAEHVARRRSALLRRLCKNAGVRRSDRQGEVGGTGEAHRREPGAVVPGADGEHGIRMREQERIDDRVDHRASFMLIAHTKTEIEHERHIPLRRVARGVIHRAHHAAVDGHTAPRVVRDLQAHHLRARRDAAESRDVVQVVARSDTGDVRPVPRRVEEEIEHRCAVRLAEIRDDRQGFLPRATISRP